MPSVDVSYVKHTVVVDAVWRAIRAHGDFVHPMREVFLLGDVLVRVSCEGDTAKLVPWTVTSLTEHVDRIVDCTGAKGQATVTPQWIARTLLDRTPDELPRAPRISRVVDVPVFGRRGSEPLLILEPGYHADAQTYYVPADGLELPELSRLAEAYEEPDPVSARWLHVQYEHEVAEARDFLLGVFQDFPFADESSRVHALALLLEPFARELIGHKPTPMYAVTATLPNTGKSLLVSTALAAAAGERTGIMTYTVHEDELRKRLTAHLIEGKPVCWFDNIPQGSILDSAVLAAALTSPTGRWDDRILGVSRMASVPIRNVWVMTANNPQMTGELARRMVPIMLTSPKPDGYRYALDLDDEWVEAHRSELVQSALTLVLNYVDTPEAGMFVETATGAEWVATAAATKMRRSYRAWSRVMGGILGGCGLGAYFLGNAESFEDRVAVQVQDDAGLLKQWFALQLQPMRVTDLATALTTGSEAFTSDIELPPDLSGLSGKGLVAKLGYWLRDHEGAPIGGFKAVKYGADSPYKWSVEKVPL